MSFIQTGGGGGGSGTVTHTGNLTLNQIVLGNAVADVKPLGSLGTTTTLLHGNAAGAPSFAAVDLAAEVGASVLPQANGGVVNVATANQGYLIPGTYNISAPTQTNAVLVVSANQIRAIQVVIPHSGTYSQATWFVVASPGDTVSFGFYSADGTTKILDTGAVVSSGTTVQKTTFSATPVPAGVYYFAWTQTGTPTTTFGGYTMHANTLAILNIQTTKKVVLAGNAATAGALNASMGTLTGNGGGTFPNVMFER